MPVNGMNMTRLALKKLTDEKNPCLSDSWSRKGSYTMTHWPIESLVRTLAVVPAFFRVPVWIFRR